MTIPPNDDLRVVCALAERVMGWTKETRIGDLSAMDETRYFPHPTDGILIGVAQFATEIDGERWYYCSWRPWRPLESMDDVMQVVDRLQEQGWAYELASHWREGHTMIFGRGEYDRSEGEWEEQHAAHGATRQWVICEAALAVVGIVIEEPS